jgi:hypothetical protein
MPLEKSDICPNSTSKGTLSSLSALQSAETSEKVTNQSFERHVMFGRQYSGGVAAWLLLE